MLARLLGADGFGVFSLAAAWVLTLVGLATLGLTMTPQRFAPGYAAAGQTGLLAGLYRFCHVAPFCAGVVIAAIGAMVVLHGPFELAPDARLAIAVAFAALPALAVIDVVEGFAIANDWHDLAYGVTFCLKPLLLPLLVLGFWAGGGAATGDVLAAVAAFAMAAWIAALALTLAMRARMKARLAGVGRHMAPRDWFSLALPALLADGAFVAMAYLDVLVLAAFAPPAEVGAYVAAAKIAGLVAFIHYGLSYAAAHHFAALHGAGDRAALLDYARAAARWTFWPALAAGLIVLSASPWLLALFGRDFATGQAATPLLVAALLIRALFGPGEQLLMMSDRQRQVTLIYGAGALINLAMAVLLAPGLGAVGVALAVLASTATVAAMTALAVRRTLGGWVHAFLSPTHIVKSGDVS
jgi:O-antigen/teichoic acid export membrane protein